MCVDLLPVLTSQDFQFWPVKVELDTRFSKNFSYAPEKNTTKL